MFSSHHLNRQNSEFKKQNRRGKAVVAHTFNSSTQRQRQADPWVHGWLGLQKVPEQAGPNRETLSQNKTKQPPGLLLVLPSYYCERQHNTVTFVTLSTKPQAFRQEGVQGALFSEVSGKVNLSKQSRYLICHLELREHWIPLSSDPNIEIKIHTKSCSCSGKS